MPLNQFARKMILVNCCVVALATGCASLPERHPLPASLADKAEIPDIPYARHWADQPPPGTSDWFDLSREQLKDRYPALYGRAHNYLAISGGGPRGAFCAGLLSGWTEAGTRPEFTIVTGVSTGALIAPFAFLGPEYDHVLKTVFTGISTDDILEQRGKLAALMGDAAADTAPLHQLLAEFVDDDLVAAIAAETANGRALNIVTTNLDAGRPVAWNIGRIAASGSPNAVQLIRDVMLASASIPAALPPVMITVEADGELYDEMHVDGGTSTQIYMYPLGLDWEELVDRLDTEGKPNVFVVRNGHLENNWMEVDRRTLPIAARAIDTMLGSVAYGDMYRIYLAARRDGLNYHLAYIPESFDVKSKEIFDPEYMTALFNLGYEMAKDGYQWNSAPPNFEAQRQ